MKFIILKSRENLTSIARKIGYIPIRTNDQNEFSMERPLTRNDYPRFHIYAKEGGEEFSLNLHLDQRKPSYAGTSAHAGEYEGDIINQEIERIKSLI